MPVIRRLYYEAFTMASADFRARLEQRDDDVPRKLAKPERTQRSNDQKARLKPIRLEGEREISHALIDLVVSLEQADELRYVKWEACTKRDQELMDIKVDLVWKPDKTGVIRETRESAASTANTSSDLLLRNILQRRSLAFDHCLIINYEVFETWTDLLLDSFLADPPPGFRPVTVEQLHQADLALFKFMIKETKEGIRPKKDGSFPLEKALKAGIAEVRYLLHPRQGGAEREDRGLKRKAANEGRNEDKSEVERLKRNLANVQGQLKNRGKREAPEGKAHKERGGDRSNTPKGKGKKAKMPKELIGCSPATDEGANICFGYNLGTCAAVGPGGRCHKGMHVCCKCFKAHSFLKEHRA